MPRLVLRKLACAALLASALFHTPLRAEPPTLQDQYLQIYLLIQDADRLEGDGQKQSACQRYTEASRRLEDLKRRNPMWEEVIVNYRIRYVRQKMSSLRGARDDARSGNGGARSQDTTTADNTPPRPQPRSVVVPETPPNPDAAPRRRPVASYDTGNDESEGLKQKIGVLQNQVEDLRGKLEVAVNSNKDLKTKLTAAMADQQDLQARLDETSKQLADARASNVEGKVSDLLTENETLKKALAKAETQVKDLSKPSTKKNVAALTTQLKLVQDQLALAQKSNEDFKQTTAELKQKLETAQNDLVAAKNAPNPSAELVQENEVMRNILTRQLQEQARRDIAKQMAADELSRLKVQSDSLRQQIEFLGAGSLSTSELAMLRLPAAPPLSPGQIASIPGARGGFSAPLSQPAPAASAPANGSMAAIANALYGAVEKIGTSSTPTPAPAAAPAVNPLATSIVVDVPPAASPAPISSVPSSEAFRQQQPAPTPIASTPIPAPTAPAPVTTAYVPPAPAPPSAPVQPPASAPAIVPPAPTPTPVAIAQAPAITPPAPVPAPETFTPAPPPAPAPSLGAPPSASAAVVPDIPIPVPAPAPAPTPAVVPMSTVAKNDPLTPAKSDKVLTPDTLPAPEAAPAKPATAEAKNYRNKPRIPEDMKAVADSARQLFEAKKYDQAAGKYQVMIDQYPDSLYAWSNLGVVRFQQQNYPEAQRALVQAVKLAPNDAFSHSVLGIVYYQMGKYEDAVQSLTKAAALDPNDAKTQNYLGIACSQKGWQEAAEQSCRKAVELDPNYGDAHFNLAVIYATQKPPSKELARRHYKKATELGVPKDAQLEKLLL